MNRTTLALIGLVIGLLAIGGGVAWYLVSTHEQVVGPEPTASSTAQNLTGEAIYTNGTYGFMIRYPETVMVEHSFTSYYHLASSWRVNAIPGAAGTPIVAFIAYDTKSDHSYPRYYTAGVRVGASSDPKEIAGCLKAATTSGETALPDVTIGGLVWKAFSFEDAAMQQYVKGVSYRLIHEGKCVALEKFAAGSNYREDAPSADDVSDEELTKQYAGLTQIIDTFTFVRP